MSALPAGPRPVTSNGYTADCLKDLFGAVEDLLRRIADSDDPAIRRKRANLRLELIALRGVTAFDPRSSGFSPG